MRRTAPSSTSTPSVSLGHLRVHANDRIVEDVLDEVEQVTAQPLEHAAAAFRAVVDVGAEGIVDPASQPRGREVQLERGHLAKKARSDPIAEFRDGRMTPVGAHGDDVRVRLVDRFNDRLELRGRARHRLISANTRIPRSTAALAITGVRRLDPLIQATSMFSASNSSS
jgi:hypothetical protein